MALPAIYSSETPLAPICPPLRRQSHLDAASRKETILALVDLLLQQSEESTRFGRSPAPSEDLDISDVSEQIQMDGVEAFNIFERRINNLDRELRNFANASRQLGSSVAILSSAFHLRERLAQILYLFRQNAADLFPKRISHATPEAHCDVQTEKSYRRRDKIVKPKAPAHVARPSILALSLEAFPEQLESFAVDVTVFLDCLNEFPEFTDEAVNASIRSFEGDLTYWASCLKEYSGRFRYPAVQRYIHDLSTELGEHLDSITSTISMFIEIGVPTIRFAQNHGAANLLNLSTVATFFSAVTATTMQFSYDLEKTPTSTAVNMLWFSSMVFSIAAAVNSLMGVTWKQAMYRSPGHRVPWWVLIWIKRSPLVFLVMSVACFSLGLCCFAYASNQASLTSTLTTVFTVFTSFGLTAVSAWFLSERFIFARHRGQKWLSDVLIEKGETIVRVSGYRKLTYILCDVRRRVNESHQTFRKLLPKLTSPWGLRNDLESGTPAAITHQENNYRHAGFSSSTKPPSVGINTDLPTSRQSLGSPTLASEETGSPANNGKDLWQNAFRNVRRHQAVSSPFGMSTVVGEARDTLRKHTNSSADSHAEDPRRTWPVEALTAISRSRISALRPRLTEMEPVHDLTAHSGLVRHLQFSPDGKFLATSSWDRTSVIFHVGDSFISHRILAHPQGFVGQVAWSPNGKLLLTKLPRIVKVWTSEDGVCKRTIDRKTSVESIAWIPDGSSFISVEGNCVTRLDLNGTVLDHYEFGRVKLHAVGITPDSSRLIGVGTLLESPTGLQPRRARPEKRVIVYNMATHQLENQTPLLNDVRDITVVRNSRSGIIALISYEKQAPPQLWKLQSLKDQKHNITTSRLTLRQTYVPKSKVDFAGPSYFGGRNHELVICAGKTGDVHIWDQESGILLHHIRPPGANRDMTCLAWNRAHDNPFMFATGSYDGAVRVWTKPAQGSGDDLDSEDTFDIGRNIPRTHSPLEFDFKESSDSSHLQPDIDSSSQYLDAGSSSSPPTRPVRRFSNLVPAVPSGRQLFKERILAYAAEQRAAEVATEQSN